MDGFSPDPGPSVHIRNGLPASGLCVRENLGVWRDRLWDRVLLITDDAKTVLTNKIGHKILNFCLLVLAMEESPKEEGNQHS